MAVAEVTFDALKIDIDVDCVYCTYNLKCKAMPRKFGLFLRDCIYLTEAGLKCHLQQERSSREALIKNKVLKY